MVNARYRDEKEFGYRPNSFYMVRWKNDFYLAVG